MGRLCISALDRVAQALKQGKAPEIDLAFFSEQLESMNHEIERIGMSLLRHQQPVARDLRNISAVLKMVTDMHRIGIQSQNIVELIMAEQTLDFSVHSVLNELSSAVYDMVSDCIDALIRRDIDQAEQIIQADDFVDACFNRVKMVMVDELRHPAAGRASGVLDEQTAGGVINQLMIAKYLERIADHAVNIAGWLRYIVTGQREGMSG